MKLKYKLLNLNAGVPVAILNKKDAKKIGARPKDRILIETSSKNPKKFFTVLDISKSIKPGRIYLSKGIKKELGLKRREKVNVLLEFPSNALIFIKKKLNKKRLSKKEIEVIVKGIVDNSLSEAETALFISLMYEKGMSFKETIFLIQAFLKFGNVIKFKKKFVVDKHCIGGVPGNITTPIVVSICSSAGLTFPKSSSRAITSAAGTADVIETLARVDFSIPQLKKIIKKVNAFMIWGGALDLVPADSKIIKIEKRLRIDPESQLLASIFSKKLAFGAKYILIDIPFGSGAKFNKKQALILKRKFEELGKYFRKKVKVVLTDGKEPIGNGIGPNLEMNDVIKVLNPNLIPPRDLREKSLFLAGQILEMTGKSQKGKGYEKAKKILDSGKAFEKFKQIITAQQGELIPLKNSKFKKDIYSKVNGKVIKIDNNKINFVARIAGSPFDKSAGVYLYSHIGYLIKKKQKLLTIYSESKSRLKQALKFYKKSNPILIK